ncbi:MAG: DUF1275 domain-containing protein [Actinobacteria bacterium]|nr:DUF1275 domain-containing protein [Actinomycetota bacterium]
MSDGDRAPGTPGAWALTIIAALLTVGSAATDIMAFTRLGSVFASVMTSNIVFLGLAAARHSGTLAVHAAVSFGGYAAGVAAGSRLARRPAAGGPWTPWVAAALGLETAVLTGFTIGWEVTGARPGGGTQLLLIALATVAMGIQSAVVVVLNISGVGTTYLTGTLTSLIDSLASPGADRDPARRREANRRRAVALAALVVGALLAGLLISAAPAAVPAIPLAVLVIVLTIGRRVLDAPQPRLAPGDGGAG